MKINRISFLISLIVVILLYGVILASKIPYSFTRIFSGYLLVPFIFILIFYYLCFRMPGKTGWLAGLCLTLVLFSLTLSYKWTSAFSDNGVIAGLLPYKDGYSYYVLGSQTILNGSSIPAGGLQAAGRPLFPGFLASLLFFTGQNLQWSLAVIVLLTGICCYLAARQVFDSFGAIAAAVFATLLYLYAQGLIGFSLSEFSGLICGCLGFILLWKAAQELKVRYLVTGLVIFMVGISARAGAFFIFPMLILWAGWAFRGEKRFSYRVAAITAGTTLLAFLAVNIVYPRLVVEPGGETFGNFSYALYGQVLGGAGWHRALQDLQTRDSSVVYQAAWEFFQLHPFSFFIGVAKAYRDFFVPGDPGIFSFYSPGGPTFSDTFVWLTCIFLLAWGLFRALRQVYAPLPAFLAACFIGIFFSIPFLPPVDGGRRFYASTMPFFFALVVFPLGGLFQNRRKSIDATGGLPVEPVWAFSVLLFFLTVISPIFIQRLSSPPVISVPACPERQVPFAVRVPPGSYVDLVPDRETACGRVPEVCLADFRANGTERNIDDFYDKLLNLAETSGSTTRVLPANDLIKNLPHFFLGTSVQLQPLSPDHLITGCATEIRTRTQSIFKVETTLP